MKLKKIYFDAYKSLLNCELTINHSCTGFVGTNESGKSNVLAAIYLLGGDTKLSASDTPKMDKSCIPQIRYEFELSVEEQKQFGQQLDNWMKTYSIGCENQIGINNNTIIYTIRYDKSIGQEERFFSLDNNIVLGKEVMVLSSSALDLYDVVPYQYIIKHGDSFTEITNALAINRSLITETEKYNNGSFDYQKLEIEKRKIESEIETAKKDLELLQSQLEESLEEPAKAEINNKILIVTEHIVIKEIQVAELNKAQTGLASTYVDFNLAESIDDVNTSIDNDSKALEDEKTKIANFNKKIAQLTKLSVRTTEQTAELTASNKELKTSQDKLKQLETDLKKSNASLPFYREGLSPKYTNNKNELSSHLSLELGDFLLQLVPKVVFWEYSSNYILQSETDFTSLEKKELNEISRPLVNLFRIGLGIKNLDELKIKITEIKNDSHERSRINKILNSKVNDFIHNVWQDYDQKIHITLERDQIRIEIFDPNNDVNSSYYNMKERSQGCQTFLSFLMTVGAEAEHNVVNNIILLLDEPETHLHPSGVRFMLQELIKISKNNLVLYATHSIFLIDRNNLDRHIILKKEKEHTVISPANIGRIGYFMQEEVLYNTLDLNLGRDFSANSSKYNFVFEGDGDAFLFNHYYDKILREDTRPYKSRSTSFQQGGKCSDIQKYFTQRPIQLGTKWIFILDKDDPANSLKKFFETKYKDYIDKDIYIFQYDLADESDKTDTVLEDLLPIPLIKQLYISVFNQTETEISELEIDEIIAERKKFNLYHDHLLNKINDKTTRETYKGKFKELLNATLRKDASERKDKDVFDQYFPEYSKWFGHVIASLSPTKINESQSIKQATRTAPVLP